MKRQDNTHGCMWEERNVDQNEKDLATISVLLERLNTQRLPRALALKKKVDGGEVLNDLDLAFLEEVFADAQHAGPLIDRHPQLNELASKLVSLYKEITDKALANQQNASSS